MLPHHCLLAALIVASARAADESSLEFELNNGNKFPAVGLGIGNMQRDRIPGRSGPRCSSTAYVSALLEREA